MHVALGKEREKKKRSGRENIIHSARALSAVACLVCKSRILLSAKSAIFMFGNTALPEISRRVTTRWQI